MEFKEMMIARNCLQNRKEQVIQQALSTVLDETDRINVEIKELDQQINEIVTNWSTTARQQQKKDYGIIDLEIDGVKIKHDLPKKVIWDQGLLASIRDKIKASGDDPSEYIQEKLEVPESKFKAWPVMIKNIFMPARTEKPGPAKIVSIEL